MTHDLAMHAAGDPPQSRAAASEAVAAAILLAQELRWQGRPDAACDAVLAAYPLAADPETVYSAALFIKQTRREARAFELCEDALSRGIRAPRLLALHGSLAQALGQFECARESLLAAWREGVDLNEWQVLPALAHLQRYVDASHPDREILLRALQSPELLPRTRAALAFALGKFYDDVGNHVSAVAAWREAHALALSAGPWDRAKWVLDVEIARGAVSPAQDRKRLPFVPVLVVGVPRSGTTLLADRLGRHPEAVNRGELPILAYLAEQLRATPGDTVRLHAARLLAAAHLRQDDAPQGWYIDKNPFNLLALETARALWPEAKVIWCRRQRHATALSLWTQSFAHPDYGFTHHFDDIARVLDDCDALLTFASEKWGAARHVVDYEALVEAPETPLAQVGDFLGLPHAADQPSRQTAIATASLWQARQPIHRHSVERWMVYAPLIPELGRI